MKNGILKLDLGSVADAVAMAVIGAVLAAFVVIVSKGDFNVFTADWKAIGESMVNIGFIAGIMSLAKDFLSTSSGSVLNITPTNTTA